MNSRLILLTTPDYPPHRIGGISTFVLNLEIILKKMNISYELFVWNGPVEIKRKDFSQYQVILNCHFTPALFKIHPCMINFIHGGELLPFSKNILKRVYKTLNHKKILRSLYQAKFNVFVSEFSFNLFKKLAGNISYDRDIVAHNCIDIEMGEYTEQVWGEKLRICCFVRDVPHKNIPGVLKLFHKIDQLHPFGAELYLTAEVSKSEHNIFNISGIDEAGKEELYKKSHLNLLLSLDHCHVGQVEGFGLTVLEAGKYGVPTLGMNSGGLTESIHHKTSGWIFEDNDFLSLDECYHFFSSEYQSIRKRTFDHTIESHGLDIYQRLLKVLL